MILFIDDEERRMETYVDELTFSGYKVEFIADIDEARDFFEKNQQDIQLLILDLMMPYGALGAADTNFGLSTGMTFYKNIRAKNLSLPIIILTNCGDQAIPKQTEKDNNCSFLKKQDVYPRQLVTKVQELIVSK